MSKMNFWSVESAQVDVSGLCERPLSVVRIDAEDGFPAWIILKTEALPGCSYRWQKACDKGLGSMAQEVWFWTDCVAFPESDSYTLSGEELHSGDRYRCVAYRDETPVAVNGYQVSWSEERRYRGVLQKEMNRLQESIELSREYLSQREELAERVESLERELAEAKEALESTREDIRKELEEEYVLLRVKLENRMESKLNKMRQWARAWEVRARQAEARLKELTAEENKTTEVVENAGTAPAED